MNEGIAQYGARFVVETDFNKAVRELQAVDRHLDKMERTVQWLGTAGVGHINAFAAALARAAASGGGLLGAGGGMALLPGMGMARGMLPGGAASFAPYTHLGSATPVMAALPAWLPDTRFTAAQTRARGATLASDWTGMSQPLVSQWGQVSFPHAQASGTFIAGPGGTTFGGGFIPPRFIAGPGGVAPAPEIVPFHRGASLVPWERPLEIIPHPTMFGRQPGQRYYPQGSPFAPLMPDAQARSMMMRQFTGADIYHALIGRHATAAMDGLRSNSRLLSPYNLMRAASGIYIAQSVGNLARYAANQTIGQAMFLEERQELLENALTSPQMGIGRDLAGTLAARLTGSSYFAGMPVTAAEMGLSRPELAEQFRQLAPIIRITARTQDEFQAGLQTGALARALLVARDPVQGTRGATVALSELYSGGPDRFRSLALRFELPRNRLREIEQEMGGPDAADPGQIVIQMLREMGFGPEYLTRRAGTLAGQFERTGALFQNFRVDLWEGSMNKVRENVTALNDTFESFLNSDAGDKVIGTLDNIFGYITGFLTRDPANMLVGLMRGEGPMATDRLARGISEYMQAREGRWVDASGRLSDAATSFREAADLITSKGIEQAVRTAGYGSSLTSGTVFGTVAGVAGLSMLDRVLAGGAMARASRQLVTEGVAAARATAAGGLATAAGSLLPIAAIAGVAALGTAGFQSTRAYADWRRFADMHPELAAQVGIPVDIGPGRMFASRLRGAAAHLGDWVTLGPIFRGRELDTSFTYYEQALEGTEWGNIVGRLQQQAALQSLGTTDENMVRSALAMTLQDIIASNPESDLAKRYARDGASVIGALVEQGMKGYGQTNVTGTTLSGVVLEAAAARNIAVVYGGNTLQGDPGSVLGEAGSAALWARVLDVADGDSQQALRILTEILEHTAQTAVNTSALNPESQFRPLRPSGQGDLFTGYMTDPDMRFVRRTGGRIPGIESAIAASTTPRFTGTAGAGPGGTQVAERSPYAKYASDPFFGGILTSAYGEVRQGGRVHRGLDYDMPPDSGSILRAFSAGSIEYLHDSETYARYPMFEGGYSIYGNTAVITDAIGGMHTFSHLSDETIARYGNLTEVRAGQEFGIQGNTGQVRSEHGGTGAHVHQEMWLPDGRGGYTHVDPLHAESYFKSALPNVERELRGGATGVNIDFSGSVFNFTSVEDFMNEIMPVIESELRDRAEEMYDNAVAAKTRQGRVQ